MTDEAKARVERLEEWEWTLRAAYKGGDLGTDEPALLMGEAADLIETQAREIERLREALREVLDHARHADDCAIYHRTRRPCSCGFEVDDEAARAALAGEQ